MHYARQKIRILLLARSFTPDDDGVGGILNSTLFLVLPL